MQHRADLERDLKATKKTIARIEGAIQVLEELSGEKEQAA
jgi:hypothetical protein